MEFSPGYERFAISSRIFLVMVIRDLILGQDIQLVIKAAVRTRIR